MKLPRSQKFSRRNFMRLSAAAAAGVTIAPGFMCSLGGEPLPAKRKFGKIGFQVTTLGLGGQAALQWTPEGVDPVAIILKAFKLGINYFDTSNVYGPSQLNFGKAFRQLNLIPGQPDYDAKLRESFFLTSKTMIRWAKGGYDRMERVINATNGDHDQGAVADIKRSLSQMFGNDDGSYPEGAYLDMVLIHNLNNFEEVEILYQGLDSPLDKDGNFGALVALRDYRDGTNITGLNPGNEKLIRHIGFSGHYSAPVMIEMIQRDKYELLDGMLVSINVNDRRYLNMQHNVIPVAQAKNIGIIGMKVFADGAMYTKEARWSTRPEHVVSLVGDASLPSGPLIEYALTTPGIHTLIIGIGHVDEDPLQCQLTQNLLAAQIGENGHDPAARRELEKLGLTAKEGNTNYFQQPDGGLTPPRNVQLQKGQKFRLTWDTPYAGDEPLSHYEILADGQLIATIDHTPQVLKIPFVFEAASSAGTWQVVAVDAAGRKATGEVSG